MAFIAEREVEFQAFLVRLKAENEQKRKDEEEQDRLNLEEDAQAYAGLDDLGGKDVDIKDMNTKKEVDMKEDVDTKQDDD